jgi:[acyl-carrier-protein] S-malonyltransferase
MSESRCGRSGKRIFLFPGQNSRDPDMLERLIASWAPAAGLVASASAVLGRDLRAFYHPRRGAAMFADNRAVQVGVFLCSHLHLEALRTQGIEADLSLGLSLGEYNHLVHIGALSFADALRLVDARGAAYDRGPRGQTVAVYPLEHEELADFVSRAQAHGAVEVAIFSSPTQNVVSGDLAGIRALLRLLEDESIAETVVLDDRLPLHSRLFAPVAADFRRHLLGARWRRPHRPYHPNVQPGAIEAATPETFIDLLTRQVAASVYWRQALDEVADHHPGAEFIEVGPRAVLFNMLRRWRPEPRSKTDFPNGLVVTETLAEVSRVA